MAFLDSFLIAAQFLTRLPIPPGLRKDWTMADLRDSVPVFPLVGLLVGLTAGLAYAAAIFVGLPPVIAALLAVAVQMLITGALHEDGLADVCDGFGGAPTRERKLEIMRDSRLGSYGAIGLMFGLALRVAAIAHLAGPGMVAAGLVAAAVLSRAAMPMAMTLLPQARAEGLAAAAGRPSFSRALLGLGIGVLMVFLCLSPFEGLAVLIAGAVAALAFLTLAWRQLGGITGDVLGGLQQIVEIACLLTIVALASASAPIT